MFNTKILLSVVALIFVIWAVLCYYREDRTPPPPGTKQTVQLYYYSPDLDKDNSGNVQCTEAGLVSVDREIEDSPTLIKDVIELLIAGEFTENEESQGITTEFPLSRFSLLSVDLDGGVLTLTFDDPEFKSSGGACRASILRHQVEATAKQFDGVEEIKILPDEIFQP